MKLPSGESRLTRRNFDAKPDREWNREVMEDVQEGDLAVFLSGNEHESVGELDDFGSPKQESSSNDSLHRKRITGRNSGAPERISGQPSESDQFQHDKTVQSNHPKVVDDHQTGRGGRGVGVV